MTAFGRKDADDVGTSKKLTDITGTIRNFVLGGGDFSFRRSWPL